MKPVITIDPASLDIDQLLAIYDRGELAILYDWLKIPKPASLRELEHEWQPYAGNSEGSPGPIRLMRSDAGSEALESALSNAVARIALSGIQGRLPQWAAVYESGHIDLGRQQTPQRGAVVDLMPRFLFGINWADSGPGFSWPEDYYATYLPGFDCYLVTASQDSTDVYGYTDEAIGTAPAGPPLEEAVRPAIAEWWSRQARYDQHRWAYVWTTGEVGTETAETWADNVWDSETGEPLAQEQASGGR